MTIISNCRIASGIYVHLQASPETLVVEVLRPGRTDWSELDAGFCGKSGERAKTVQSVEETH